MVQFIDSLHRVIRKVNCSIKSPIHVLYEQRREIASYLEEQDAVIAYMEQLENEKEDDRLSQQICRNAIAACLESMHEHCIEFLKRGGGAPEQGGHSSHSRRISHGASYEEWIQEYHPENVRTSSGSLDHRFYLRDSDHRIIWNGYCDMHGCPERKVQYLVTNGSEEQDEKKEKN